MELSYREQLLKVRLPLPEFCKAWLAVLFNAMTQPVPAAPVLAHPTARVVIVGPVDMNSADKNSVCGCWMTTST